MTKRKPLQRTAALLLCVFLCLGAAFSMMGAAHAADVEPSGIRSKHRKRVPTSVFSPPALRRVG